MLKLFLYVINVLVIAVWVSTGHPHRNDGVLCYSGNEKIRLLIKPRPPSEGFTLRTAVFVYKGAVSVICRQYAAAADLRDIPFLPLLYTMKKNQIGDFLINKIPSVFAPQ